MVWLHILFSETVCEHEKEGRLHDFNQGFIRLFDNRFIALEEIAKKEIRGLSKVLKCKE